MNREPGFDLQAASMLRMTPHRRFPRSREVKVRLGRSSSSREPTPRSASPAYRRRPLPPAVPFVSHPKMDSLLDTTPPPGRPAFAASAQGLFQHILSSMSLVDPIPYLFWSLDKTATSFKTGVMFTPAALALRHRSWS